jgi:hypothetical protein
VPPAWQEVFHLAGLLPLLILGALQIWGVRRDSRDWWLAAGFAISWLADLAAHWADPWLVSHVYSVGQAGCLYGALTTPRRASWLLGLTGLVAAWSLSAGPVTAPAVAVWVVSAAVILVLIWKRRDLGFRWWGLLAYFGLGLAFRIWFPLVLDDAETFRVVWLGYQACRMAGLSLVSWALLRGP